MSTVARGMEKWGRIHTLLFVIDTAFPQAVGNVFKALKTFAPL